MSRRKQGRPTTDPTTDLRGRAAALAQALDSGGHRLDGGSAREARTLLAKVGERQRLSGGHTVVALAGATGSGKSSLFNALSRLDIAPVGARRPTTATPMACVWGAQSASDLLDWLDVPRQHRVSQESALDTGDERLHGLVLLDLPDYDSTEVGHRMEVERLLELVDVFVWVTDPQKYADAALHRRYLAPLAGHDAVTLVVLNQSDRLTAAALDACARDLDRLVAADGLTGVGVLSVSAATGEGVDELRERITAAVQRRTAWSERLSADLDAAATGLRAQVGGDEPGRDGLLEGSGLVEALAQCAHVPTVVHAVDAAYQRDARVAAGWPFTRWVQHFRPDPLRRLRLRPRGGNRPDLGATAGTAAPVDPSLVRSSLPPATAGELSSVQVALRTVADRAAHGLPGAWRDAVRAAALVPVEDLRDAADQAVVSTELERRRPAWWRVLGAMQLVLALAAVLGLLWLVALAVMGWLRLPQPQTPSWGPVPVPTWLLLGGLLIGLLLGGLVRLLARSGGRRRARRVEGELTAVVRRVADQRVIEPVGQVLLDHRATREALDRLSA